ncbi:MAG: hypothetical protein IKE41_01790 [Clostridia bacterium]|nr:hypothetical protein [Clostridia bacterium]
MDFETFINSLYDSGMNTEQIASSFTDVFNEILQERAKKEEAERKAQAAKQQKIDDFYDVWAKLVTFLYDYDYIDADEYDAANITNEEAEKLLDELDFAVKAVRELKDCCIGDLDGLADDVADFINSLGEPVKADKPVSAAPTATTFKTPKGTITVRELTPEEAKEKTAQVQKEIAESQQKVTAELDKAFGSMPKLHFHGPNMDTFANVLSKFLGK